MHINIVTLFPEMFGGPFDASIIKRAKEKGIVDISFTNIRDFATDKHKSVDDHPYGGGTGMILRVDIVDRALESAKMKQAGRVKKTILLDPIGTPLEQAGVERLAQTDDLILVCGHYEGVDERIRSLVDEHISVGDYVLSGGEIPAMIIVDAVTRLLPGVLEKDDASKVESFSSMLTSDINQRILEYPQYTRPVEYKGMGVPDILLSGDHAKISKWREDQAIKRTEQLRPDLMEQTDRS